MTYGVMHKETGLYFGGFRDDHSVIWTDKNSATKMDKQGAHTQAALFLSSMGGENVQRKPKALK